MIFVKNLNEQSSDCPIVRIISDDIYTFAILSRAENSKARPFNTMAGKSQDPRIALAIKNRKSPIASKCPCKRNWTEFATPLKREYLPQPKTEWAPTIEDFLAAGGDPAAIMANLCQLTNDIHPILGDGNLCVCPELINPSLDFDDDHAYCMSPYFADSANLKGIVKEQQPASILPKDNIIMRTILQLASRMIEDEGTLPFWAGVIDAVTGEGKDAIVSFKVHPRRKLSPENRERIRLYLRTEIADNIRFHFRVFHVGHDVDIYTCGITGSQSLSKIDPLCTICDKSDEVRYHYGHRDGERTYDKAQGFPHVCLNIAQWRALRPLATLKTMTVSQIQLEMFQHASTICHELAHALESRIIEPKGLCMPPLNDENATEIGFALECFLLGGIPVPGDESMTLMQWPCQFVCDNYATRDIGEVSIPGVDDAGPERYFPVDPLKVEAFFLQGFWDDPNPPVGAWKKMWLRSPVELALNREDFDYFTTGDTPPDMPELKRIRPNALTKQRVREMNKRWKKLMQSTFRSRRDKAIAEKRKAEFHEQQKGRLDKLWAAFMQGV
jgi:hypothetical protein